jgi:hypothetical protein
VSELAVFIDWQNAYQQARQAFGLIGPGHEGQFSPLRLAQLLAARNRRGDSGHLAHVEVHRGQPLSSVDRIGHAAVAVVNHTLDRSVLESVADSTRYGAMARRRLQQRGFHKT